LLVKRWPRRRRRRRFTGEERGAVAARLAGKAAPGGRCWLSVL